MYTDICPERVTYLRPDPRYTPPPPPAAGISRLYVEHMLGTNRGRFSSVDKTPALVPINAFTGCNSSYGNLNCKLCFFHKREDPACCCRGVEDVKHIIFDCPLHAGPRMQFAGEYGLLEWPPPTLNKLHRRERREKKQFLRTKHQIWPSFVNFVSTEVLLNKIYAFCTISYWFPHI